MSDIKSIELSSPGKTVADVGKPAKSYPDPHPEFRFVITDTTMRRLLAQDKPGDLIALYSFLTHNTNMQPTATIKANERFISRGLRWSVAKVKRVKSRLRKIGLIETKTTRYPDGKIEGHYVRVKYLAKALRSVTENPQIAAESPVAQNPTRWLNDSQNATYESLNATKLKLRGKNKRHKETAAHASRLHNGSFSSDAMDATCSKASVAQQTIAAAKPAAVRRPLPPDHPCDVAAQYLAKRFPGQGKATKALIDRLDWFQPAYTIMDAARSLYDKKPDVAETIVEELHYAFRFCRLNNNKNWPIQHSWQAMADGFRDSDAICDCTYLGDLPQDWIPEIEYDAEAPAK